MQNTVEVNKREDIKVGRETNGDYNNYLNWFLTATKELYDQNPEAKRRYPEEAFLVLGYNRFVADYLPLAIANYI